MMPRRVSYFDHIYPNPRFLKHAFASFFSGDIIRLLKSIRNWKPLWKEVEGYFPVSSKSADVVHALLKWVHSNHVEIRYGHRVERIITIGGEVKGLLVNANGKDVNITCGKIILCTGGCSYPATGSYRRRLPDG